MRCVPVACFAKHVQVLERGCTKRGRNSIASGAAAAPGAASQQGRGRMPAQGTQKGLALWAGVVVTTIPEGFEQQPRGHVFFSCCVGMPIAVLVYQKRVRSVLRVIL